MRMETFFRVSMLFPCYLHHCNFNRLYLFTFISRLLLSVCMCVCVYVCACMCVHAYVCMCECKCLYSLPLTLYLFQLHSFYLSKYIFIPFMLQSILPSSKNTLSLSLSLSLFLARLFFTQIFILSIPFSILHSSKSKSLLVESLSQNNKEKPMPMSIKSQL